MKSLNQSLTLAMLTAFATTAIADDDPVAELTTPDSSVSIGVGHYSGEREQFGIYDDIRDSEYKLLLDADVRIRDDASGTWMTLGARNLGIDNRSIDLGYERQGNFGVNVDYSRIPYMAPYTVNSGITGLGKESQAVPDTGYTPGSGRDLTLGMERDNAGVEFYKYLNHEIKVKVGYRQEEKNGDRHWGRGGQPEFAAEPIDWTNQVFNAMVDYAGKDLQVSGGYIGTWYSNHNDVVTTTNGSNTYNLSLPFDNQANQFFVNGGFNFTPTTRGTFRLSYTKAEVDEKVPSAITALAWDGVSAAADPYPAAPTKFDAGIETTVIFLGITSRPMDDLSLNANLRYHKVDETTPADLIVCRNCADADPSNDSLVHSTPLDYKTLSGMLEGTYRLPAGYSVVAGIDLKNQDRTVPFGSDVNDDGLDEQRYVPWRADLDETTYRVQLRKSMSDTVNGALAFSHSKRDGSRYAEAEESLPGEGITPDSIDPINISDRKRNKVRATVDWVPVDPLNLTFNYETSRDEYSGHTLGVRDGDASVISVDAGLALSQDWQLTGWISRDITNVNQHNHRFASGSYAEAEMYDDLREVGDSVGLGLDGKVNEKLNVGANLEWTHNHTQYDQRLSPDPTDYQTATTGPLPDITSTVTMVNMFAEYALAKNSDLRVDLIHQRWKTDDWTWSFSDGTPFIYGTTRDGTMVTLDPSQSATFVGVRYKYKF